jgi:hypothetical protein
MKSMSVAGKIRFSIQKVNVLMIQLEDAAA